MENLALYNRVRAVPNEAKKPIEGGRLKGMTDINPMWRIKVLTNEFGVCGFGWKTEVVREWTEIGDKGVVTANVRINLYVKMNGEWSEPIPGIGGSDFVAAEKGGLYTDSECFKKAYTDAMSVACKALGIGADVYFEKDSTKYDARQSDTSSPKITRTEVPDPNTHSRRFAAELKANGKTNVDGLKLVEDFFGKKVKLDEVEDAVFNEFMERLSWNL